MKKLLTPNNPTLINLLNEIKVKLQQANKTELLKSMGYNSIKKGLNTLEQCLECNDICTWLKTGHYDFHYTSKEFLEKLSTILDVDSNLYKAEIDNCVQIENEHKKIKDCYIFVNTNFHRTTHPIFALAFLEGRRLLFPDKKYLMFKADKQIFKYLSKLIKKHYLDNDGELMIWGKIDHYVYHHSDGNEYVFDSSGCLVNKVNDIAEAKATVSIKGKNISLSLFGGYK